VALGFDPAQDVAAPFLNLARPKMAILREQGVNSHVEMAYAMAQAGFDAHDVHMSDLQTGRARLDQFQGLVACGGFSYGDTLGAGEGWARSILFNPALAEAFSAFFAPSLTSSGTVGSASAARVLGGTYTRNGTPFGDSYFTFLPSRSRGVVGFSAA